MRFLMLSSNTGEGHNSTAAAISEVLEARGIQCETKDVLACLSPKFSDFICNWHGRIYRTAPALADVGYRALDKLPPSNDPTPVYELLALGVNKLWQILLEGNYDAVICVHVFAGMMMTELRRAKGIHIPCCFVATDYTCSPTVEQCDMDTYFIPAPALTEEFVSCGLPEERLVPSGIPVRQTFYRSEAQADARRLLGLPKEGVIALLMGGSMGCGPMPKIAHRLIGQMPEGSLLVAVCGRNEKLYEALCEEKCPQLRVLGYTKEISSYMDAADFIITKPGGLSSTEAANKHLPTVFINAVGGCESKNFDFFLRNGFAVGSDDAEEVIALAASLANDASLRCRIRRNLTDAFRVNSACVIADHMEEAAKAFFEAKEALRLNPEEESREHTAETPDCSTAACLAAAFAEKARARMFYEMYAEGALAEGQHQIARAFGAAASQAGTHARLLLQMLQKLGSFSDDVTVSAGFPFRLGTAAENLNAAAEAEKRACTTDYPRASEIAREEGFPDAQALLLQLAQVSGTQARKLRSLHERFVTGSLWEKPAETLWQCESCGYTVHAHKAPDLCPLCGEGTSWREDCFE